MMVDAFGAVTWWGFSPALDLQSECSNLSSKLELLNLKENEKEESDPFNILMIGAGDCRHILKTLAHAKRWPKRKINIYVVENNLETLGRHLLLLSIAMEPKEKLGLKEKTELFLELFGNSLIRPQTSEYLQSKCNDYIRMVTDFGYLETQLPCINMSQLKFKERDMLEGIFKFWRNTSDPKAFDICTSWEARLRRYLGVRYDSRVNVFDWDLVMKLQKMASIIHSYEYKGWREHGVAFELREDCTYEVSNRTLASGLLLKKGDQRVPSRGYWGDIINSPYLSFGIESEEERLFKENNGKHIKTATNVAEFNITALMHELITGEQYKLPENIDEKTNAPQKATITEIIEEEEDDDATPAEEKDCHEDSQDDQQRNNTQGYLKLDGFTIHFMPLNCIPELHKKSKYSHLFHCIYFSNSMVHLLTQDVQNLLADVAMVTTETTKFMLDLQAEQKQEYLKRVTGMAQAAGCKPVKEYDGEKDNYATFMFKRNKET